MTLAEAADHLADALNEDGGLYSLGWYLGWSPTDDCAVLDGHFTAQDLLAIATFMRETAQ